MDKLILIAVDEPKTLKAIRTLLLYNGYPLLIARTGEEMLRAALEGKPDLILVNLHEFELGSIRILKKHASTKKVPLLALGRSIPLHLPSLLEAIRGALASPSGQAAVPQVRSSVKRPISHMAVPPA